MAAADTKSKTTTAASKEAEREPTRLPHEQDESSDSQRNGVRPIIQKAHDDLASGAVDTDKSKPANEAYQKQKNPG